MRTQSQAQTDKEKMTPLLLFVLYTVCMCSSGEEASATEIQLW